ncbi:MAG: zinc ABC transporter substrate-binding protein [Eubacteriales bacterium]|nr:zinc ABC transporter substrate-binding protein [Eubacteriales bacterium]
MRKPLLLLIISAMALFLFTGCTQQPVDTSTRINVAVGIVPQATFVEKVGGDLVSITTMIPPGNSPENYQTSVLDMQALEKAAIYFTLSMPTETAYILPKLGDFNQDLKVVDLRLAAEAVYAPVLVAESHDEQYSNEAHAAEPVTVEADHVHEAGSEDPHVWLSPKRVIVMVQRIADELALLDEANRQTYQQNAAAYIAELTELDSDLQKQLATLEQRSFLIYHGSYAYFAADYGLNMVAIEIAGKQATATELQSVIDYAKANQIKTVFYQAEFDDQQAQTVAAEMGGTVLKVAPLSPDYIESLRQIAQALIDVE